MRKFLVLAVCAFACLAGDGATKVHERLKYSTKAVKQGVWSTQFAKCKSLAVELGVPLVVLWVNPGCGHCRELCYSIADSELFKEWQKKSGFVYVIGIGATSKTGAKVKAFTKTDRTGAVLHSFPFCAVYLNPKGSVSPAIKRVFSGNGLSASGFKSKAKSVIKGYARITLKATSGGVVKQVMWQKKGKKVTLRAISNRGYRLLGWYDKDGNRVSKKAAYTIKVKENVTYKAKFKKE